MPHELPDEVKSEQATVHSAPFPWTFLFELNVKVSLLLAVGLKFEVEGPFFRQNLRNTWMKSRFWENLMHCIQWQGD